MRSQRGDADRMRASVLAILGALCALVLILMHGSGPAIDAAIAVAVPVPC